MPNKEAYILAPRENEEEESSPGVVRQEFD
jgi:hypothetical protein